MAKPKGHDLPTFCWDCGRRLQRKKGGGYYYKLIKDKIGNIHPVHKCYPNCEVFDAK